MQNNTWINNNIVVILYNNNNTDVILISTTYPKHFQLIFEVAFAECDRGRTRYVGTLQLGNQIING